MEKIVYLATLFVAIAIGLIAGYYIRKRDDKRFGTDDDKKEES